MTAEIRIMRHASHIKIKAQPGGVSRLRLDCKPERKLYQILSLSPLSMPKKHFMCSMNRADARLKGWPRFQASTLVAVSAGLRGR